MGIEIAVGTFADAVGNVNIERKRLFVSRHASIIWVHEERHNTWMKIRGLKLQHVSIPQHTKAVAFELVQFSDDFLAEFRFQMRDEDAR
jgi:hypothetical protein